jgi:hypothetical protein
MTQAISSAAFASLAGEFAVLVVDHESVQAESAARERDAAREAFLSDAQKQVEALHDAANATMQGALIGASMTIAGGALQMSAASFQYEVSMGKAHGDCATAIASNQLNATVRADLGEMFAKLAEPSKALVGDSTAARFQAEAKRHETLAEQAKWQADDARAALDKDDKRGDKTLDVLQGMHQDDNSSAKSIIGRI